MICKVCPYCDAHLDFGERCDCEGAKKETLCCNRNGPNTMFLLSV